MTMKRTLYCDAEDCDTHGSSEFPCWITLSDPPGPRRHFCNADCLMKWAAANSEPTTIIRMDDPPEDER